MDNENDDDQHSEIAVRIGRVARQVLDPLARLFVAHGLTFKQAETILKEAFFSAGQSELKKANAKPNIGRISVSTGLHRKDVKRFIADQAQANDIAARELSAATSGTARAGKSPASRLYTKWSFHPDWRGKDKEALSIKPQVSAASFDQLAREVTGEAHPRTMLDELLRLGLVEMSPDGRKVRRLPGGYVPSKERTKMLRLLGDSLADHVSTSVGNVIDSGEKHLEQSVSVGSLLPDSVGALSTQSREIWKETLEALVQSMAQLEKGDIKIVQNESKDQPVYRVRIGMYFYSDMPRQPEPLPADEGQARPARKRQSSKNKAAKAKSPKPKNLSKQNARKKK